VQPALTCLAPATHCTWDRLTTIAVCPGTLEPSYKRNCSQMNQPPCIWSPHNWDSSSHDDHGEITLRQGDNFNCTDATYAEIPYNRTVYGESTYDFVDDMLITARALKIDNMVLAEEAEILYSYWMLCIQTFKNVTAYPNKTIEFESSDTVPVDHINLGLIDRPDGQFIANGVPYNITGALGNLSKLVVSILTLPYTQFQQWSRGNCMVMRESNITEAVQRIAATISGMIRNDDGGDNRNLTMLKGTAWYEEVQIKVNWPWIILPLIEVVLTMIFLVISITLSRNQPLLKMSQVATLIHGLDGWSEDELEVSQPETAEKLEHIANKMTAVLERNADGRLKFVRRNST
jgi:hypothetical protein